MLNGRRQTNVLDRGLGFPADRTVADDDLPPRSSRLRREAESSSYGLVRTVNIDVQPALHQLGGCVSSPYRSGRRSSGVAWYLPI